MLLRFSFNNLYSYKNDVTLDFTNSSKNSLIGEANTITKYKENYRNEDNKNNKGIRTVKVMNGNILYGANASGKSNLIIALRVLQIILSNGIELSKSKLYLPTFKFTDETNKKIKFNIEVLDKINGSWYKIKYKLIVTEDLKIVYESLSYSKISNKSNFLGKEKTIFDRKKQIIEFANESIMKVVNIIETENIKYDLFLTRLIKGINKERFQNIVKTIEYKIAQSLFYDIVDKITFANIKLQNDDEFKTNLENNKFKHNLLKELKKFDFSIQDIAVRDYPTDNQNELTSEKSKPYFLTIHKVNGKEYTLSYGLESTGTHNFIKNYIYLFDAMQNGKFVVIDEFENSYHPELQEELLRQLLDNSRNNSGFQFFLTTHNTHFMSPDYFSKDQINFVDKDYKTQISDIYKLSDYDDISYKDDWEKFYREHFLGGVPNIE